MAYTNGQRGNDILDLQKKLNAAGYGLAEDSIYGPKTDAAYRDYQSKQSNVTVGAGPDGVNNALSYIAGPGNASVGVSSSSSKRTVSPSEYGPYTGLTEYGGYDDYSGPEEYGGYKEYTGPTEYGGFKDYTPSDSVNKYNKKLGELEEKEKPTFSSKYEGTIQNILDGILNRKSFDINTDQNYKSLYDNYAEAYKSQASRAMRDSIANAAGMSGGYGNSYAQMVGQQAYDQTMEGLNSRNIELMNLAYQIYGDETADRYNRLGAVKNLDDTDYGRYRDSLNDFNADRDYYAGRYDSERNFDYNKYINDRDFDYNTFADDRNFNYNKYINDRDFDYNVFNDDRNFNYNKYINDRNFDYDQFVNDRSFDYGMYADDRAYNQSVENEEYNRYNDALDTAMKYAQSGLAIPSGVKKYLSDEDLAIINGVMEQANTPKASSGGSPSGSSKTKANDASYSSGDDNKGKYYVRPTYLSSNNSVISDKATKEKAEQRVANQYADVLANMYEQKAPLEDIIALSVEGADYLKKKK